MAPTRSKFRYWLSFSVLWSIFIFIASVIPAVDLPSVSLWEADKLVHAFIYCILTLAVAFAMRNKPVQGNSVLRSAVLSVSYSVAIELVQRFLPTRSFDLYDILANCIGTAIATGLLRLGSRRRSA